VGGNTKNQRYDGVGEMETGRPPADVGAIGAGIQLGFQVRLLGPPQKSSPDDFNMDPE
jgi:hypothetical protein